VLAGEVNWTWTGKGYRSAICGWACGEEMVIGTETETETETVTVKRTQNASVRAR
jgi:hypothetical protein